MSIRSICSTVILVVRLPVLALLYLYTHYVSLLFTPRCRFYPSCSRYAYDAVRLHGVVKGLLLAASRLLRCHPWHQGGIDPVPETSTICCAYHLRQPKEKSP